MNRTLVVATLVTFTALVSVVPAFADAGGLPWETPMQIIVNALNGSTGTLMATLAVMVIGILALAGRVSWGHAGSVLFGIAFLFGASRLVAIFNG